MQQVHLQDQSETNNNRFRLMTRLQELQNQGLNAQLKTPPDSETTIECLDRSLLLLHELISSFREEERQNHPESEMGEDEEGEEYAIGSCDPYMSIDYDNH